MFLETERLILRKIKEQDFEDYFREYLMDPEMDRLMGRDPSPDIESALLGFNWFLNKEKRAYVLVLKENGTVIGNLTIYDSPPPYVTSLKKLEGKTGRGLSFAISRQYRRRGLMQEAVSHVIDHLFRMEDVDYINCGYLSFNNPSRELQQKLGFTYLTSQRFVQDDEEIIVIENILWNT